MFGLQSKPVDYFFFLSSENSCTVCTEQQKMQTPCYWI